MSSRMNKRKIGPGNRSRTNESTASSRAASQDSCSESDSEFTRNGADTRMSMQGTGNTFRIIIITTFVSGIVYAVLHVLIPVVFDSDFSIKYPTRDIDALINDQLYQHQKHLKEMESRLNIMEREYTEHLHLRDTLKDKMDQGNEHSQNAIGQLHEKLMGIESNILTLRNDMQPVSESVKQDGRLQDNIEAVKIDCSQEIHKVTSDQSVVTESLMRLTAEINKIQYTIERSISTAVSKIHIQIAAAEVKMDGLSSELLHIQNSITSFETSLDETEKSFSRPVISESLVNDMSRTHILELRLEIDSIKKKLDGLSGPSEDGISKENTDIHTTIQKESRKLVEQLNDSVNSLQNKFNEKYVELATALENLETKCSYRLNELRNGVSDVEKNMDIGKQSLEQHFRSELNKFEQTIMDLKSNVFKSYGEIVKSVNISNNETTEDKMNTSGAGVSYERVQSFIAKNVTVLQSLIADLLSVQKHFQRRFMDVKYNWIHLTKDLQQLKQMFQSYRQTVDGLASDHTEWQKRVEINFRNIENKITLLEADEKTTVGALEETMKSNILSLHTEIQVGRSKMEMVHKAVVSSIEQERREMIAAQRENQMISAQSLQAMQTEVHSNNEMVINSLSRIRNRGEVIFNMLNNRITNTTLDMKKEADVLRTYSNMQIDDAKEMMTAMQSEIRTEMEMKISKATDSERGQRDAAVKGLKKIISEKSDDIAAMDGRSVERLTESHRYCDSKVKACEFAQDEAKKDVQNELKSLSTKLDDINSSTKTDTNRIQQDVEFIRSNLSGQRRTIFEITNVLVNKEPLILIIIILAVGEVIIIAILYRMTSKQSGYFQSDWTNNSQDIKTKLWNTSSDILNKIKVRPPENEVCIVSFHGETKPLHKQFTNSIMEGDIHLQHVDQVQIGIFRHTDIPTLPAARMYLIFVDFNERHIILEDPSKGLGDLRLTTVRAAKKIGGDVAVIYVRDSGSRQLADGFLYNPDLTSIKTHRELSLLNDKQRVFSIFDQFTTYQKLHLRTVVLCSIGQ